MSVSVKNVSVVFPGIKALKDVSLTFEPGNVHAVLGANGSGKSTLVKVLTGIYKPEKGAAIAIGDNSVSIIKDPSHARELGVRVVHQEAPLINSLSVAECIALFKGYPKNKIGKIMWKELYKYSNELLSFLNIDVDPKTLVSKLSSSERAMVAMAIAIGKEEEAKETKLLILDEADASIPEDEAEHFLERVKRVAELGIPVIMVTHRLKAVKSTCSEASILNDGQVVYSGNLCDIDEDFIVKKMLPAKRADAADDGVDVNVEKLWSVINAARPEAKENNVLEVNGLISEKLQGITFELRPGEILGIAGITDSGVSELPLILGGAVNRTAGDIVLDGKALPRKLSPRSVIDAGLSLVPSDRFRQGGVMTRTLRDNVLLPNEKRYYGRPKLIRETMETAIKVLDIRPPIPTMKFGKFSGGNQQKAIICKWLLMCPKVLVLDDPTYGVDPAARLKIFAAIRDSAANNVGVVVFSTEPEQLAFLCSRVLVLRKGKVVNELSKEDNTLTRESIARWCYA
ncbi:MAG TPA: sugar ABC transporter ATP-binding protein [Bacillota bacterium]|nr:sugar ABC transporter ATP-binding protein [Bacillota bacterium]